MRHLFQSVFLHFFTVSALLAHSDTIIEITKNGTLVGLPEKYHPSSIQLIFDESGNGVHPIKFFSLTLGKSTIRFPTGLTNLIESRNLDAVIAYASWYHDKSNQPHYLVIEFRDPGFDNKSPGNPGILMRFNLDTGKLYSMGKTTTNKTEGGWQRHSIKIPDHCTKLELAQIYQPIIVKLPLR